MKKRSNWFWGIFLLLAGAILVVGQITGYMTGFSFWMVAATVLLVSVFVHGLLNLTFPLATLSLAVMYILYQNWVPWLPYLSPVRLLFAALLVGIGLSLIIRRRYPRGGNAASRRSQGHWENGVWIPAEFAGGAAVGTAYAQQPQNGGAHPVPEVTNGGDDNHPAVKVRFGAANRYLHSSALESGHFQVSFGALEVFFDHARLASGGAVVYVDCDFGSVKLFVPKDWNIVNDIAASLGGVNMAEREGMPDPAQPALTLKGNVSVGAAEIIFI